MHLRNVISGLLISLLFLPLFTYNAFAQETTSELTEEQQIIVLLEQIQLLLTVIEALQAQIALGNQNGGVISTEFTNDLSIGSKGFEVRALQEMLNTDPITRIASSGDGSPGRETDYYGVLTAKAVSRFQELYRAEILTPNDLVAGNGFFGPSTRAKMNALIRARMSSTIAKTASNSENSSQNGQSSSISTQDADSSENISNSISTNTQNSIDLSALNSDGSLSASITNTVDTGSNEAISLTLPSLQYEVYDGFSVGEASSYVGASGETITIQGTNLTNGTKIHFDTQTSVSGFASSDGTSLSFVIPNIEKGPYELTFSSETGEDALRVMDFAITYENATAPEIFSIAPSLGPEGSLITIYGSGFTPTNNQIEFGQTIVEGIPSTDGKTIKVNVVAGIELPSASQTSGLSYAEWPVFIYVANANGRALEPSVFVIKN